MILSTELRRKARKRAVKNKIITYIIICNKFVF